MLEARRTPEGRDFYAIAHRAGNNFHALEQALLTTADAIECDFWHAGGRLALRHERRLGPIPLLVDKWFIRFQVGELSLRTMLDQIAGRTDLFIDIKSKTPRAADALLALHRDHADLLPPVRICSPQWRVLDRIAEAHTDLPLYYSIGHEPRVEALLRRVGEGHPATGTSIRHTLLTRERADAFHAAGLEIFAWTVNNADRARELLDWGVEGIISDDFAMFDALGNLPPERTAAAP